MNRLLEIITAPFFIIGGILYSVFYFFRWLLTGKKDVE